MVEDYFVSEDRSATVLRISELADERRRLLSRGATRRSDIGRLREIDEELEQLWNGRRLELAGQAELESRTDGVAD